MGKAMKLPFTDGTYAVPDPDNPGVVTMWWAVQGMFKAWPLGRRWAPMWPIAPADLSGPDRAAWKQQWYDDVYFPWKARVIEAIAVDPAAAAAEFDRLVPAGERPKPDDLTRPKRRTSKRTPSMASMRARGTRAVRRDMESRQAMLAAVLSDMGNTVERVALILGMPETTAWRRIQRGKELLAEMQEPRSPASPVNVFADAADALAKRWGAS